MKKITMMFSKTITLSVLLALSTSSLFADDAPAPVTQSDNDAKPAPTFTDEELAKFKEERQKIQGSGAIWASSFNSTDTNKDGIWTWEEAEARNIRKAKKHNKEPEDFRPIFDRLDSNGDGVVTILEHQTEFYPWLKEHKEKKLKMKEAQTGEGKGVEGKDEK